MKAEDKELIAEKLYSPLGVLGLMALVGFAAVFVNIPWEWSMFMDDTLYNTWMPKSENLFVAIREEVIGYWKLGRFYPVKYLANLLKWRFLPNDPYVFRYFNFGVFLLASGFSAAAAMRAVGCRLGSSSLAMFVFLLGSVFLHKPLLETISLNPLGETWVFFFFSIGSFFFFSRGVAGPWIARLFFLLVALSKEPAAIVFLAASAFHCFLAWREPHGRKRHLFQAAVDLAIFAFFLGLALYVMSQGSFTKGAYFSSTPWMRYARDFTYKIARYAVWASPFVLFFLLSWRRLLGLADPSQARIAGAAVFYSVMAGGYLVFMSTQGIVAYQEIPASMAIFGLFSLLVIWLLKAGWGPAKKVSILLLVLFSVSYFISITRWERFVRGIVEPRRAVTNLLATGEEMTLLVPVGEMSGHVHTLIGQMNPRAQVFEIDAALASHKSEFKGTVYVIEFPTYMGELPAPLLASAEQLAGGWDSVADAKSYRIYRGRLKFTK